jgi:type II restriction/modification system DNA methylase subunit YeeA
MINTLNPESITVLDPACGSGHILVEAYEVLKGIYLERGYRLRDIPRLILEKNLYGLDIDDRAAQLAGFALLMKARADDRRLLESPIRLNVLSLQESKGLDADNLIRALLPSPSGRGAGGEGEWTPQTIRLLLDTFEHAKTFGSLIQIPKALEEGLPGLEEGIAKAIESGDVFAKAAAQDLLPLVQQAKILAMKFDAVVANPPYMGGKGMNGALKDFAKATFFDSKSDLFAMFIERGFAWCKPNGFNGMVTMQSWMFLSSYEAMREKLLTQRTLSCMVHMGNGVMGIAFGTAATVTLRDHVANYAGSFSYCENEDITESGKPKQFPVQNERLKVAKPDDFKKIPGRPVAYWVSDQVQKVFYESPMIGNVCEPKKGIITSDDNRFFRYWHEVSVCSIKFDAKTGSEFRGAEVKWAPLNKGGDGRKWFGNLSHVMKWLENGFEMKEWERWLQEHRNAGGRVINEDYYFRQGITWADVTSAATTFRLMPEGMIFNARGPCLFPDTEDETCLVLGYLNSVVCRELSKVVNPTICLNPSDVGRLPYPEIQESRRSVEIVRELISISEEDWNRNETSWGFKGISWIKTESSIDCSWTEWAALSHIRIAKTKLLEEENNRLFIDAYSLQSELSSEVTEDQIVLARADREKDSQRLISYAVGCMMGRYSLDEPGLIYAHAGNVGFDPTRYNTFPADADGILPITDELWFEDDAAHRIREFLLAVWPAPTLDENMAWLAESLGTKAGETPDETIRRYLASSFFKDHLQTYKKRPIYWLFSSGKQGAFQALVYLHRYHEGTMARMRAEYVVPLTGKIQSRIEMLEKDARLATSTATRNKLHKQIEKLRKKHVELLAYDEKLRHHADRRITLDLDEGVKVNYGKFGDLLAEVKAVTGGAGDE